MDYILAFSAGLLSFLSPCVLPLIPLYLSHLVGTSVSQLQTNMARKALVLKAALFSLGFSLVFIILGVSVSAVSKIFLDHIDIIRQVGGVLIMIFGLHMTGIFKLKVLHYEKRLFAKQSSRFTGSGFSSVLLGMAFAVGWTPCIGPILSSILIYAGSMDTVAKGVWLLVAYSLGFAVPLLFASVWVGQLTRTIQKFAKYLPVISIISGIIMIGMGVLVFTNKLEFFSRYGSLFNL